MTMEELYQDRVWTQRSGVTLKLKKMGPSHRRNLLTWIERNGAKLRRAELNAMWQFSMFLNGEMAIDAIDSEINHLESISAEQYVDELPLVVRLRKLVAKDSLLPLAERRALDEKAKARSERKRREAVLASFDEPDPEPPRPPKQHTPAEDAAFEREWGPLPRRMPAYAHRMPVPHPASQDDGFRLLPPDDRGPIGDPDDGWPDTRVALNGDGYG